MESLFLMLFLYLISFNLLLKATWTIKHERMAFFGFLISFHVLARGVTFNYGNK